MMRKSRLIHLRGLLLVGILMLFSCLGVHAQILQKEIKAGTKVVTDPLKATQSTTKDVVQPIKDVRKDVKTVTDAPKEVSREVDKTKKGFDQAENEVDRAKKDVEKVTGKGGNDKSNPQDSTANKTAAADGKTPASDGKDQDNGGKYVPPDYVPEKKTTSSVATNSVPSGASGDVPRAVPPGSRDNKTPSGPMPVDASPNVAKTDPDPGLNPDQVAEASASNEGRFVALSPNGSPNGQRPRPDYSNSPARLALEKAEFDVETLEQLFKYSNWQGPEREHTVRAIEYSLNELQQSIVEIKKLDPGFSTWRFEERYKEMRTAFQKAKQS
jgi:hypothetical protein